MNCSSQYKNPAFCLKYTGTAVLSSIIISIKLTVTTFFNKLFFINLMSFKSRKRYVACLLELLTSKTWLCITRPTRLFCLHLYCFHCYEVISATLTDWYLRSLSSWWYIQAFDDISCIWTWPDRAVVPCATGSCTSVTPSCAVRRRRSSSSSTCSLSTPSTTSASPASSPPSVSSPSAAHDVSPLFDHSWASPLNPNLYLDSDWLALRVFEVTGAPTPVRFQHQKVKCQKAPRLTCETSTAVPETPLPARSSSSYLVNVSCWMDRAGCGSMTVWAMSVNKAWGCMYNLIKALKHNVLFISVFAHGPAEPLVQINDCRQADMYSVCFGGEFKSLLLCCVICYSVSSAVCLPWICDFIMKPS